MAAIGIAALALLGAWGWSYTSNKALIATAGAAVEDYRIAAKEELSRKEISGAEAISGSDLTVIASTSQRIAHYARRLRAQGRVDAARRDVRPGAARPTALLHPRSTYRNALERMLRSRLILRLEQQITASMSDPIVVYEALKVYLMLGGKAPKVEEELIVAWMTQDWEDNLLPGRTNERQPRKELESNLHDMLELAAPTGRHSSSTATLVNRSAGGRWPG